MEAAPARSLGRCGVATNGFTYIGGNHADLVADLLDHPPSMVGADAHFHHDSAGGLPGEEPEQLRARDLLAQHGLATVRGPVQLEVRLRDVDANDADHLAYGSFFRGANAPCVRSPHPAQVDTGCRGASTPSGRAKRWLGGLTTDKAARAVQIRCRSVHSSVRNRSRPRRAPDSRFRTVDNPGRGGGGRQVRERAAELRQGNAHVESDKATGARGARDGAGQHPTLQAVRRQSGLAAVARGHRFPAGLRRQRAKGARAACRDIAGALFRPIGDSIRWPGYLPKRPDTS